MKILLVTPAQRSRKGNWITAARWRRILRRLGHQAIIQQRYEGETCDVLIALHALKSFDAIERFHREHPGRALIVTQTGTDLYRDIRRSDDAQRAMRWADRMIVLQPEGLSELTPELRAKTRVIRQSATPTRARVAKSRLHFDVCVVGHLRPVKDPFRCALAAAMLPSTSRLRVLQAGAALSPEMADQARAEMARNRRYRWLDDLPRWKVKQLMARCQAMVLSSHMEGGANVVSEAIVAGLPVLSTRIPGSIGMLGENHRGYFATGDTEGLAELLQQCEMQPDFLQHLADCSRRRAYLFEPAREEGAWVDLLAELAVSS